MTLVRARTAVASTANDHSFALAATVQLCRLLRNADVMIEVLKTQEPRSKTSA